MIVIQTGSEWCKNSTRYNVESSCTKLHLHACKKITLGVWGGTCPLCPYGSAVSYGNFADVNAVIYFSANKSMNSRNSKNSVSRS